MGDRRQQRREESRLRRARQLEAIDPRDPDVAVPPDAVLANPEQLRHNNTHDRLPRFYLDRVVRCRECGTEEVWPAERQKWWYEVARGDINTRAVLCRACRAAERERKDEARRVHLEGIARKRDRREP